MTNAWLIAAASVGAVQIMLIRLSVHRLPMAGLLAIARLTSVAVLFAAAARCGHCFDAAIGWLGGFSLVLAVMARKPAWT